MGRLEVVELGDLILFALDDLAIKLDQFAAMGADQVVVMLVIVEVFIARPPITEPLLAR